jgi:hypothetical protein
MASPITNAAEQQVTTLKASRCGFPLAEGYAVSDYFMQGLSFGDDPWLLHLVPPPQVNAEAIMFRTRNLLSFAAVLCAATAYIKNTLRTIIL